METQIKSISVAFSPISSVNFACSIDKDLRTIKQLQVIQSSDPKVPFTIRPNSSDVYINIDEVAHIIYGKVVDVSAVTCESLMQGYQLISNVTSPDGLKYTAVFWPLSMQMMPDKIKYQRLDIEITGNNTVSINMQGTADPFTPKLASSNIGLG